jgi:hypothetical protein
MKRGMPTSSSRYFQSGEATTMRGLSMRWTMPLATGMLAWNRFYKNPL